MSVLHNSLHNYKQAEGWQSLKAPECSSEPIYYAYLSAGPDWTKRLPKNTSSCSANSRHQSPETNRTPQQCSGAQGLIRGETKVLTTALWANAQPWILHYNKRLIRHMKKYEKCRSGYLKGSFMHEILCINAVLLEENWMEIKRVTFIAYNVARGLRRSEKDDLFTPAHGHAATSSI